MDKLDSINQAIFDERLELFAAVSGPRVGDFVIFPDGEYRRLTDDWGNHGVQTTCKGNTGSFYFAGRFMDYSGALAPLIPKPCLLLTDETREGPAWFFSHNEWRAHNRASVMVPCRVYQYQPK